MEVRKWKVN